jgi:hypothetical protein
MNHETIESRSRKRIFRMRSILLFIAVGAAIVAPALGFIVFAIDKGGWLLITLSIVLSPIVIFIALGIAAVIEHIYETLFHPQGLFFSFPGRVMSSIPINQSYVNSIKKEVSQHPLGSHNALPLIYATDGVMIENREEDSLLHIMFALYNSSPGDIIIYEICAHVYLDHIEDGTLTLPENRTQIQLSIDNSILSQGKVYSLSSNEAFSMDLTVRVSETHRGIVDGAIYVFGLFISFRRLVNGQVERFSVPSDAIYIYRNPPASYMGGKNFVAITADNILNLRPMATRRVLLALLKKHLLQTRIHVVDHNS